MNMIQVDAEETGRRNVSAT